MLEHHVIIVGRCLAGIIGFFLLYLAIFVYENEEGKVLNWLDELWIHINDMHISAVSKETAFIKGVLSVVSKRLDKLFGERLFTFKAVYVSVCFSLTGVLFFLAVFIFQTVFDDLVQYIISVLASLLATLFLYCGFIYAKTGFPYNWLRGFVLVFAVGFNIFISYASGTTGGRDYPIRDFIICFFAFPLISIGSDFLFISVTRWILKRCLILNSWLIIAALVFSNLLLGVSLVCVPFYFMCYSLKYEGMFSWMGILVIGYASVATNSIDLLIILCFLFLALMMLFHRLFWPILERPIYVIGRYKFFVDYKKTTFCAGVALLAYGLPSVSHFLTGVINILHL